MKAPSTVTEGTLTDTDLDGYLPLEAATRHPWILTLAEEVL